MKNLFLAITFIITAFTLQAHEYYFAFAEIEYNVTEQRFEGTIIVTTHDLETGLREDGYNLPVLESISTNDTAFIQLEEYLFKHFRINTGDQNLDLHLIGSEVFLVGTTNLYFESEKTEIKDCTFMFDLLMDAFEGQQNKITFTYKKEAHSLYFLHEQRKQTFKLENEKIN